MKVSMKLFIRKNAWDISVKIEENGVEHVFVQRAVKQPIISVLVCLEIKSKRPKMKVNYLPLPTPPPHEDLIVS